MGIESVTSQGRAAAESRMASAGTTCVITRAGTRDSSTFSEGSATVYSGPCEVADGGFRLMTVGGTESQQATKTLKLPAGTTGPKDGDIAVISGGDAAGVSLRLLEVTPSSFKTSLRIPCLEA